MELNEVLRSITAPKSKYNYLYKCWKNIHYRCSSPNCNRYQYYGGKGIKVCARWLLSLEHFIEDMGLRPTSKHQIDRIDSNGDYCPENCRWVLPRQQMINRHKPKTKTKHNKSSKYRGVRWHPGSKNWEASIKVEGKWIYIGIFSDEESAYMAFKKKYLEYHGKEVPYQN